MQILKQIVDGKKVSGSSGHIFDIYNPASGNIIMQIEGASANDTAGAIKIANKAFASWSQVPPSKRAQIMFKYRELIIKHTDELAELISQEHG